MHDPIATHPYYKIDREISHSGQQVVNHDRIMYLYLTKVMTEYREFLIEDVYDMSYRRIGEEEGILYLHTKQGLFPYNVRTDPTGFIKEFKKLARDKRSK
jgi:hypothetical protein